MRGWMVQASRWQAGCVRILAALGLMLALGAAMAQRPPNTTVGEMARLPAYCPDTMGFGYGDATYNTSPRAPYWVSMMGKGFWAMHHYCWALINLHRAQALPVSSPVRADLLKKVMGDYVYVINHTEANFVMLPEIYTRIGEASVLMSDYAGAHDAYGRARALKPDYWPAYSQWAEALIKRGLRADAEKIIVQGLQNAPDSTVLAGLYRSLGRDPSTVEPIRRKEPAAAAAPASEASTAGAAVRP